MARGHVQKLLGVAVGGKAVAGAAQGFVQDGGYLGAGQAGIGPESPIPHAYNPPLLYSGVDIAGCPPGNIREVAVRAIRKAKALAHGGDELRPGDGAARLESAVLIAAEDARLRQGVDGGVIPVARVHVLKLALGHGGLGRQQVVEHLGHLGAGHGPVRIEAGAGFPVHVCRMAAGHQQGIGGKGVLL